MKNILGFILFVVFLTSSCSSGDSSSSSNNTINPPNWIRGTWLLENSSVNSGFRFTNDDLCIITLNSQTCYKEGIQIYNGTDIYTNVEEEITNDYYFIEITISSSVTSFEFEKVSNTKIRWLGAGSNAIYVKQ